MKAMSSRMPWSASAAFQAVCFQKHRPRSWVGGPRSALSGLRAISWGLRVVGGLAVLCLGFLAGAQTGVPEFTGFQRNPDGTFTIAWRGGVLQTTTNLLGPWTEVGAVSPHTWIPGGAPQRFFRVKANLRVVSVGDGTVTLEWDPWPGASSYNVYMASEPGVTKGNYAGKPDGMRHENVTSPFTHSGLANGRTYYFVVTAVVDLGVESNESNEVSATPQSSLLPSFGFTLGSSTVSTRGDPSYRGNNRVALTFTTQNGFQGPVELSLVDEGGNPVQGLSLSPASVNVTRSGQQFTVYVLADDNIPLTGAGRGYPVRVRARSGSLVREQPLTVDVWTRRFSGQLNYAEVAYGNGIFVMAGHNGVYTVPPISGYDYHNRIYVYDPQTKTHRLTYDVYVPGNVCGYIKGVAYDPVHNTWVAVGDSNLIMVSTDNAQTWQVVYGIKNPNSSCSDQYGYGRPMRWVRYVNDRLWAGGWLPFGSRVTGVLHFSQDGGYTWGFVPLPVPQGYSWAEVRALTFGQGKYVAVGRLSPGDRAMMATSADGVNWNVVPFDSPNVPGDPDPPLNDVLYVPDWDKFVAVGVGFWATSVDGVNWSVQRLSDVLGLQRLAYGNGTLIAGISADPPSRMLVSADGQNWRFVATTLSNIARSIAFGGGIFAYTTSGEFDTSP